MLGMSSADVTSAAAAAGEERAPLLPAPPSYSDHDTVHNAADSAKKPSSTSRIVVIESTLIDNDDDGAAFLESQSQPANDLRCWSFSRRLTLAFLAVSALLGVVAFAHAPFFRHHHHPRNGPRLRDALASIPFNTNAGFCRGRGASAVAASLAALDDAYASSVPAVVGPVLELGATLRGVAITADGERAVPAAVAAALSLRRTGSALPVELWVRGPGSAAAAAAAAVAAADLAPGVVTVRAMLADADADALAGLDEDLAAAAAARSAFSEVLVLPSSAVFFADPEPLFDSDAFRSTGVLLWSSMSPSAVSGRPGGSAAALVAAADTSMLLVDKATPAFQAG
ncbi:hypothetical protein HK405_012708, partial [Cladochytrium tenue]